MLLLTRVQRRLQLLGDDLAALGTHAGQRLPSFLFQPCGDGVIADVRAGQSPPTPLASTRQIARCDVRPSSTATRIAIQRLLDGTLRGRLAFSISEDAQ